MRPVCQAAYEKETDVQKSIPVSFLQKEIKKVHPFVIICYVYEKGFLL
ncbi:hypothetical protein BRYFOR_05959 [Marvinbryantia formatexigens DSM 14469]|uniref:Uncharacterized protein n=1 Tax=Marvinbryantia formatexigens DSM 14469 TaxID=478749 RepID=C6LBG4_9FIRM|nr:hypothetical protein BRYFOR_05959 [Marvinbryantia formatexigens DSM 14469]